MRTTARRWGHCLAIRIPRPLAREIGLESGSTVELRLCRGTLVVEPLSPTPTLEELLAGVTPRNLHREPVWDPTDGREVQ